MKRVVIIGGGFGGLDAARALDGAPVEITLVDRHNYHLFQPLLYQVATASLSPGDVASPIRWILRHQANVRVLLAAAHAVDTKAQQVLIDEGDGSPRSDGDGSPHGDGSPRLTAETRPPDTRPPDTRPQHLLPYDYLIVAAGASHTYFNHPEWEKRAPGLKTLDDALAMRQQVLLAFEAAERESDAAEQRRLLTFVIVGGGPTGVELAGALAEIARHSLRQDFRNVQPESARIVLLEGSPDVLGAFPADLRGAARRTLERLEIEVRTGSIVTEIDADGVVWRGSDGIPQRIRAQTVLWAAGVAASPLAKSLDVPLDRAGRVLAEPTLAVPGHPNVFVVGDICALQQDGRLLPGVAQVAKQEGAHAARNIVQHIAGTEPEPFRYRDYGNMATIGRGSAVADFGRFHLTGAIAWFLWLFIHIFWLIGFRNRLAVVSEWAWSYVTFQRRVRLITGERLWPGPDREP